MFFNEAAGSLVGRRFEETGALGPREWGEAFGPFDAAGDPIPWDQLPLTIALQHGRPMHSRMHIHSSSGDLHDIEVSALPIVGTERLPGRDRDLLARRRRGRLGGMKATVWGARGSVPAPGPETNRYGGNTSCVQVSLDDGSELVLDAGTGIRPLGLAMTGTAERIHILLTHLHMDHIQGLMFFAPLFHPETEVII